MTCEDFEAARKALGDGGGEKPLADMEEPIARLRSEDLAGRVIEGLPKQFISSRSLYIVKTCMTARNGKGYKRKGRMIILEQYGKDMSLEMIDPNKWNPVKI